MKFSRRKLVAASVVGAVGVAAANVLGPIVGRGGVLTDRSSRATSFNGDPSLPKQADVVIIGAGILGITSAIELASRGLSVVICEKGVVAGEQSSRAFGWVTNHGISPELQPFAARSVELWHGMNQKLGVDTGFRASGYVQASMNDAEIVGYQEWIDSTKGLPYVQAEVVSGEKLKQLLPGATSDWKAALHQPGGGSVEPNFTVPTMALVAKQRGVKIITGCAVRTIETAGGVISGVVTEKGLIKTSRVVLAGGTWSRPFLGNLGINLPVLPSYLSMQRLSAVNGPAGCGSCGDAAWRRQIDGSYSLGAHRLAGPITLDSFRLMSEFAPVVKALGSELNLGLTRDFINSFTQPRSWTADEVTIFEKERVLAPTPDNDLLDEMLKVVRTEFPQFQQAKVVERWGGIINVAPDFNPVVDEVSSIPGLALATAFTFGMALGPAGGERVAQIVSGDKPAIAGDALNFSRFVS